VGHWLADTWVASQDFLDLGGGVLVAILAAVLLMWTLILERYWFFRTTYRRLLAQTLEIWRARPETTSWHAQQIRRALVSRVSLECSQGVSLIKTLVALCPMLGLLGTVTGMVQVFDVMAFSGSGNPRAMASGVSRATIPTMAGMVAAISGLLFSVALDRRVQRETERVADELSPAR
jgi:biopolymer transport protein ExbB